MGPICNLLFTNGIGNNVRMSLLSLHYILFHNIVFCYQTCSSLPILLVEATENIDIEIKNSNRKILILEEKKLYKKIVYV